MRVVSRIRWSTTTRPIDTCRSRGTRRSRASARRSARYRSPDMVEFYTSGRASNEAAFLYQLFAREYGTNNFPDCSNMCHEATSVGLPESIGVGKGTVTLEDFDHCDALFCIGHNPGTNHPRMLTTLREVSKRGVPIIVFNPLRERGLERFTVAAAPRRDVDAELDADRVDLLSGEGRRRHRGAEGNHEDPRGAGREKPRRRRPGCSRPRIHRKSHDRHR